VLERELVISTSNVGIRVAGPASGANGMGPINLDTVWVNQTDGDALVIQDAGATGACTGIYMRNITLENFAANKIGLLLDGTTGSKLGGVQVNGLHIEASASGITAVKIDNVHDVSINSFDMLGTITGSPKVIHITNTVSNVRISIDKVFNNNIFNPVLQDDKNSVTMGAINVGHYDTADMITYHGEVALPQSNTPSSPTIRFGDGDSGIYESIDDTISVAIAGAARARIDSTATAGDTALLIWDVDNATVERVTVGAADSGGVGYKVVRSLN